MNKKISIISGLILLLSSHVFARTRTITLHTPGCLVTLSEESNATVDQPPNEEFSLPVNRLVRLGDFYTYIYNYAIFTAPVNRGGVEVSLGTNDDGTFQISINHMYPNFFADGITDRDYLPEGFFPVYSFISPARVGAVGSHFASLESMIRFERIFGAPYISSVQIDCDKK